MGYTHYWRQKRGFTPTEWAKIVNETKRVIAACGTPLAGPHGEAGTKPIINSEVISLNGLNDDSHETFHLECKPTTSPGEHSKDGVFNFCKTEQKPYDPVVVSILHAADVIAPGALKLSSDGGDYVFKPCSDMKTYRTKRTYRVRCKSGLMGWRTRLRNNYGSFDDWRHWSECFGLAERLGYGTARAAWACNPVIEGSTNPSDFRLVKP